MPNDLYCSESSNGLHSSIRGLYKTPSGPLPFLKGVIVHAFVLERPQGNIIIYNAPGISQAAGEIQKLGAPERLLINHHHEAMYGMPNIEVPVWVHEKDRAKTGLPITGTFSERQMIDDDLEVIPTPGHTPGTTTFLWNNGQHRVMFPGDSLWVQGDEWKAVLLGDSDRSAYLESLTLLREVEFDILAPWGIEKGKPFGYAVTPKEAKDNIDRIIARLSAGQDA